MSEFVNSWGKTRKPQNNSHPLLSYLASTKLSWASSCAGFLRHIYSCYIKSHFLYNRATTVYSSSFLRSLPFKAWRYSWPSNKEEPSVLSQRSQLLSSLWPDLSRALIFLDIHVPQLCNPARSFICFLSNIAPYENS